MGFMEKIKDRVKQVIPVFLAEVRVNDGHYELYKSLTHKIPFTFDISTVER